MEIKCHGLAAEIDGSWVNKESNKSYLLLLSYIAVVIGNCKTIKPKRGFLEISMNPFLRYNVSMTI